MNVNFRHFFALRRLHLCWLVSFFCFVQLSLAQDINAPRFFKLNVQSLSSTTNPVLGSAVPGAGPLNYENNYLFEASLRFPIKWTGDTQLYGKLDFENEILFGFYSRAEQEVEDIELFQSSASLILLHSFSEKVRLSSLLDVSSNSTKGVDLSRRSLRFSQVNLLERQGDKALWGIGAALTYGQQFRVLPLIKLEAPLFGQWSIEALLPSKLLFVNALSKQSQFYFGARGNAATYVLQQQDDLIANAFTGSHYRRLSINGVAGYERQLTPWLGLSLEMGVTVPYRAGIYDAENNRVQLHNFNDRISPHLNFGLFFSLPQ